jgi:hypothetical protein
MSQKRSSPRSEAALPGWLTTLSAGIGKYGATVGLSPGDIADAQANCAFAIAVLGVQGDVGMFAQGITRFKDAALWATEPCTAWPAGYTMPDDLAVVTHAGVVPLLTALIARIKKHPAYTKQMGEEMGIEGPDQVLSPADKAAMKPLINLILAAGGQPLVEWKKGNASALEIWVDRGDGHGFIFLTIDSVPDYLDTFQLPAPGASAVWKYKAIYRIGDERVGQWSDETKFTVAGA